MEYRIAYDTTQYVRENITEVKDTLIEAFILVLIVVFVFLQGVRATAIPMIAIPVSLIATFAMMAAFGFSINTLTMCGLVLAIGLVVDDAIIVVENIEKFLERGMAPLEATRAAMAEITAPIVTIGLVLAAVFVPVAFIPGLTGRLYNQFALTIVFSFLFSAFNSLTFTPAIARLLLRPKHGETKFPPFRWFNRGLRWVENSYDSFLDFGARRWALIVVPSLGLLALTGWLIYQRPKAFIPIEDQGYLIVVVQTPDGTTREPTSLAAQRVGQIAGELARRARRADPRRLQRHQRDQPDQRRHRVRHPEGLGAQDEAGAAGRRALAGAPAPALGAGPRGEGGGPPAAADPGTQLHGRFRLHDRGSREQGGRGDGRGRRPVPRRGPEAPRAGGGLHHVLGQGPAAPVRHRPDQGPPPGRARLGRLQRPPDQPGGVLRQRLQPLRQDLEGRGPGREPRPLPARRRRPPLRPERQGRAGTASALGKVKYALGPIDVPHYNLYTAARITGQPAPGYSSGQAITAMQEVAAEVLPEGFGYEWTGTTYQEQKTGNMATYIFALSILCVFLFMAALYESWIRPLVIILTVPLATFGAMVGLWLYDLPLDLFGQIGLVMLIGLETKNAILIVEFGVELMQKHGMGIIESAKEASRQRLRPILMTSFAFVFGVLPMARATGAGAYSRNSLGIVIAFGIAVSTVLGRFVIPIYYVLGERLIARRSQSGGIEGPTRVREPQPESDGVAVEVGNA